MGISNIERAKKLVYNRKYFDNYKASSSRKENTYRQYESDIIGLLEYFDAEKIEINDIEFQDIKKYVGIKEITPDTGFRAALIDFFIISKELSKIKLDIKVLKKLKVKVEPDRKAKLLSISDIIKIRNTLDANENYQLLFTFEMFYVHGVSLEEIAQFGSNKYSFSDNTFTFTSKGKTKKIKLCGAVVELISNHKDLLVAKESATYSGYIKQIGKTVIFEDRRDKIISGDIKKTRDTLFPTCPHCKEKRPNSAEFWALVEFEKDINKKHWIYCKDCAPEIQEGA